MSINQAYPSIISLKIPVASIPGDVKRFNIDGGYCLFAEILKDADLSKTSAKKVRQELEEKLQCDLTDRKKEIDGLVMDFINNQSSDEAEESEGEKPAKRQSAKKATPKRKKNDSDDDSEDGGSDDDYKPNKGGSKAKTAKKKKAGSDSDSDGEWKKAKSAKKVKKSGGGGKGFTRPIKLSQELSNLMGGAESLPRHEVVKKVWALIKERNLYDPKNKQFAICDAELQKVIGVKRFRTFGMMKYLQPHFIG